MKPIILPFKEFVPKIDETAFIAPGAVVAGDVEIGEESSVWFNVTMRGDIGDIRIGKRTNIQDNSVIHMTSTTQGTYIGDEVTVGHMALLHSCTIEDRVLIGMQSCVMDDALVQAEAMVAAGSLVTPRTVIPSHQLWAGRPAHYVRDLTAEEIAHLRKSADDYVRCSRGYMAV
jgi:carbonic anhydrase/acetyltransferase-like protein (isoleucine patch superfamily)